MIQIFKLNRRWQTALCLLLMIGLAVPFGAVGAVDGQVDAGNTASAPTINGQLTEAGWNLANSAAKTTIGAPNNTVTFGALWNSTHLFVGVRVLDANLFNDSANTWEDDSVEIYIDANHNHGTVYDSFDRQFVKGYNDTGLSSIGSTTGVTHAWAAITGGYSVELAIPWSNLGVTPTPGMIIGFDVGYNDDDNAGTRDSQAVWWGTINNYNNTSGFGNLMLMPAGGVTNTPTRTNTPVGPTFTPTRTATRTNTPVGPTNTPTRTATRTNTPVGPTNTPTRTNTPTGGQSAYPSGVAWAVPGTIQAENFDLGGENVAYHDLETANSGGQYRTADGVDIEATTDTGGGFNVGWTRTNEWMEYTINVPSAGNYTLTERVASGATTGQFRVEFGGVDKTGVVTVPNTGGWQTYQNLSQVVNLSAGVQVMRIFFTGNDTNLNYFTLASGAPTPTPTSPVVPTPTSPAPSGRGATLPYIEYEAENNSGTNGAAIGPSRAWTTVASESSGRRAIQLNATGQYVQWTSSQQANSVVVRYVIPDAPGGGGTTATISLYVNNVFRQKINLNSRWAWVYGAWANNSTAQWSNNPASGSPHKFYDEARALVGDIPAGATVKLQRDSNDTAAYYVIDLIDLEQVAPPLSMPAGFISITSCGATPNDGSNDSPAIQTCINNARSQGQGVWIPAGTFNSISASLDANNATIRGAGMWHSTIEGGNARFNCAGGVCRYYDFAILGDTVNRNDTTPDNGFEGTAGSGSRLERIWIEHTKCGYWVGTGSNNLVITGSRMRNMFADGVNFYNGSSNSVVEQTHLRNMGDDALASWSPTSGGVNNNNVFRFNTVQNTWFAHGIAIYGGSNNKIQDNVVLDQVTMGGIFIAQAFTSHAFSGTTLVQRNTLIRTGGDQWGLQQGALKLGPEQGSINGVQISDILIQDSTYSGLWFSPGCGGCVTNNVQVSNVQIQNSGTAGIYAQSGGSGNFSNVVVSNGGLNNAAGFNFIKGAGNVGW